MNEIKCPNCGKVFQVDEAGYASIVSQVRNALFEKEVEDRVNSVRRESAAVQEKALAELNAKHRQALTEKDLEINHLKDSARAAETEKQLAVRTAIQEKENEITELRGKVIQEKQAAEIREQSLKEAHKTEVARLEAEVEQYRDYDRFKKCSKCELLPWCRGCPAVASGTHGDFYDVDPQCWKEINNLTGEKL